MRKKTTQIERCQKMLDQYDHNVGTYCQTKMWRVGYICALRDSRRLTWIDWQTMLMAIEKEFKSDE